jgi:hypothetical protein
LRTLDINHKHTLALVQDSDGRNTRYVDAEEAPTALEETVTKQVYLGQLHYVASHAVVGLAVHDRIINGKRCPKDGWLRWKPAL